VYSILEEILKDEERDQEFVVRIWRVDE